MSIKRMTDVWDKSIHTGSELLLLLALADSANDDGYCWPGIEAQCKKTRLSESTVIRRTKAVEASGELIVERNRRRGNHYLVVTGFDEDTKTRVIEQYFDKKPITVNMTDKDNCQNDSSELSQLDSSELSPVTDDPLLNVIKQPRPPRTTSKKTDVVREETGNGSAASASSMTSDRFSILDNSITDVQNAYRSGQLTYDDLPELILREAAGKNRTTLLAWLTRKEALGQLEGRYVEMVQAVADVTGLDLTDSGVGGRIGKFIRAALWGAYAKMPYTPEEIQDCFGPNGYWRQKDWRGKQGQAVTLGNVFVETLSKYRQETRHAVTPTASTQTEGFTETWESTGWDPD